MIEHPWLALVPAGVFLALFALSRKLIVLTAAGAWLAYFPYEYAMKLRILCSGECNIRVDLLAIYPVLLILSASALVVFATAFMQRRG